MGITIEFYSASPQELVEIFASDDDEFFNNVGKYPMAYFSLHLLLPDDLDHLCQTLREYGVLVPPVFRELLVEQLWLDDPHVPSASLTLLQETFARSFSVLTNSDIEEISHKWEATFPDRDSEIFMYLSKALLRLRDVTQDVVTQKKSLILHLLGDSLW